MSEKGVDKTGPLRTVMEMLSSMRTAIVLLVLIAITAVVGTVLPDAKAQAYVYGRVWFHVLLGLLGLTIACCMVWRKRIGMSRIWSLLTHVGILLVLLGAMVTVIFAERGAVIIVEGRTVDAFYLEGEGSPSEKKRELGFTVRLVDFRIDYYPPVDYLYVVREGAGHVKLPVVQGKTVDVPGTDWRLTPFELDTGDYQMAVEAVMDGGKAVSVPATPGTTHKLDDGLELKILRYEPSFKIDIKSGSVGSDTDKPNNPALQVAIVRDGKADEPRWLFSKIRNFEHKGRPPEGQKDVKLSFQGPRGAHLTVKLEGGQGEKILTLNHGERVHGPWEGGPDLVFVRQGDRVKEYESEVEVLEDGKIVKRHVIRVNSPLVHNGTKLSQFSYDQERLKWTRLGVSRDKGVWFVYAGFIAMIAGLMGRFYVSPILRQMRSGRRAAGGSDGAS